MEWNELKIIFEQDFEKIKAWLISEYAKITSGRVNPNMLNYIKVDVYGDKIQLVQIANISLVDARQICIKPYDRSNVKEIAKALSESNLNVNPLVETDLIRINFAPLTNENRIESVKKAKQLLEQSKVKVRDIRQKVQAKYKKLDDISKDVIQYFSSELDVITKKSNAILEGIFQKKENELMKL